MRSSMRAACFCEAKQSFLEACVDRYGQNPSGVQADLQELPIALVSIHSTDMQQVRGSTKGCAMTCHGMQPTSFVAL